MYPNNPFCWTFRLLLFVYLLNNLLFLCLVALGLCCSRGLSLVAVTGGTLHCGARASRCGGFSCCGAQALGTRASVVSALRLQSVGSTVVHGLQLFHSMRNVLRPEIEPMSPALAGRFLTTVPPGKSRVFRFFKTFLICSDESAKILIFICLPKCFLRSNSQRKNCWIRLCI